MQLLKDFLKLFYPDNCVSCYTQLLESETVLCVTCRHGLPIIDVINYEKNKIAATFYGRTPVKKAISFLEYRKHGIAQKLIHELKYKGNEKIGSFLGDWFGYELQQKAVFLEVDYIIPVPLHPKKERVRGYNQVEKFGESLSKALKVPFKKDVLYRVSSEKTQTLKQRFERFSNTNTTFSVKNKAEIAHKHLLLIDDVITTGATLEACAQELLQAEGVTISIATMAYTERN